MKKIPLVLACLFTMSFSAAFAQQKEDPGFYIFSIYFGGGSYYIDEEQRLDLYHWLDGIPEIETHLISIHSHTDNIGSIEYNRVLSRYRSEAAFEELVRKGIPSDIIDIADFGEENPVYDNRTWEGRLRNRRVDIIIKKVLL